MPSGKRATSSSEGFAKSLNYGDRQRGCCRTYAAMSGKRFDEDEYYDEEDYYDYDDYDDEPVAAKPAAAKTAAKGASSAGKAGKGGKAGTPAPAAAAGASTLAQCLCDPPPLRPSGKPQKGAVKTAKLAAQPRRFPVAPPVPGEEAIRRFDFSTPSPDERVLAAQRRVPGYAPAQPAASTATSSARAATNASASSSSGVDAATNGLADIRINGAVASAAQPPVRQTDSPRDPPKGSPTKRSAAPPAQRRSLSGYQMEAGLTSECEQAQQGGSGSKPKLHLVVLGHVDAGKSTLMGRLLHDLGYVGQKVVHKTQKEAAEAGKASFSWAWVLDERPEERARGVTVDVATTRFETPQRNVTLLDAPGHRDFVPNMIAGAAQADAALLLVDGSPGGFEAGFEPAGGGFGSSGGGQTREHAQLARSLGVEQVAVVVSKLDTCDFSQDRFEHIRAVLLPFLKQSGFREAAISWLPAVGLTGENLTRPPTDPLLAAWWKGPTVVGIIDSFKPTQRNTGRPLRMPIADVFKGQRGGTAVGGKLEGGALKVGMRVAVQPSNVVGSVKSIEVDGQPATLAMAGDSADVTLTGIDAAALSTGSVLCHPDWPVPLVSRLEARIVVLEVQVPILKGQQVTLHAHSARETGQISHLLAALNPKTGEVTKSKPRALLKGQTALVEITPARSMCLEEYSDYRALGRIALRDGGRTVAVGIVTRILE
ncbi:hypothetical protein WJX72_009959 [[Myrmecia] bisecta]|uniref:Tr-type G domain-containing protein n=1 Tax=[Myrmecia] bisecta TaxID=41462 RepID=A0AAW1R911_9CHLO